MYVVSFWLNNLIINNHSYCITIISTTFCSSYIWSLIETIIWLLCLVKQEKNELGIAPSLLKEFKHLYFVHSEV